MLLYVVDSARKILIDVSAKKLKGIYMYNNQHLENHPQFKIDQTEQYKMKQTRQFHNQKKEEETNY